MAASDPFQPDPPSSTASTPDGSGAPGDGRTTGAATAGSTGSTADTPTGATTGTTGASYDRTSFDQAAGAASGAAGAADLLERVVRGAHQAIDDLAGRAAPGVEKLQHGIAGAGDSLRTRADRARQTGDEWAESLRCTVREKPLAAVATAVAIGVLLARLVR